MVLWTRCVILVVTIANSRPRRTREQQCFYCRFEMTPQVLPLNLSERTSHRSSNDAIWDLRHDLRRDLTKSRWLSFVNTTWLGPGPSLKWDSVRVQAKSWVKSQVKTVNEYGPRLPCLYSSPLWSHKWVGQSSFFSTGYVTKCNQLGIEL